MPPNDKLDGVTNQPGPTSPVRAADVDNLGSSKVVKAVFDHVLDSIHRGRLQPGERLSDATLAAELGVSRTPVREALLRLREIGVVEASASRFTRVAIVSPRETVQALVVWAALYSALVDEVLTVVPDDVCEAMARDHEQFAEAAARLDLQEIATTNFSFFSRMMALSENAPLLRGIVSVVHIIRLGSFHLPDYIDFAALFDAQAALLAAVKAQDVALGHEALLQVRNLRVPT